MSDDMKNIYELMKEYEVIVLEDEEGNEEEFYEIARVIYEGKDYICLEPVNEIEGFEEGDLLIYEIITNENGDEGFKTIEDEEVIESVFQEFLKLQEEIEND